MLQQEQGMADAAILHQVDNRLLKFKRGGIVYPAEIDDVHNAEGHIFILCHCQYEEGRCWVLDYSWQNRVAVPPGFRQAKQVHTRCYEGQEMCEQSPGSGFTFKIIF